MRRKDREVTELQEILSIIEEAGYLHLSLFDGAYPYIVPLHYGWEYKEERLFFYMHAAREGHKLDLIRQNPCACIQLDCRVSLVSGGEVPCHYGAYYASVIATGRAQLVENPAEKIHALQLLMSQQTGRDFSITPDMADSVAVICFEALDVSAKARVKA